MYIWVKALHLVFMVTWFAGLFYLPRLFVYHAMCEDEAGDARFKVMERKLYFGIMAPGAVLTVLAGVTLIALRDWAWFTVSVWLHAKLALVAFLIGYHLYLGQMLKAFADNKNRHGHRFYRWLNEIPVLALLGIVILAIVKPFS